MTDLSKLHLPAQPTTQDYQCYIKEMCEERGFSHETAQDAFILLSEEIGELARIVRKTSGMKSDANKTYELCVEEELADIFMYVLYLCNIYKVDLEQAFRDKEAKNMLRTWN